MKHTVFHRLILLVLTAAGLFVLLYLCLFAWVCYAESHMEPAPETDVIIVLGAQVKADGTPSVQLEYRLETALEAYQQQPQAFGELTDLGVSPKELPNFVYGSYTGLAFAVAGLVPTLTAMLGKSALAPVAEGAAKGEEAEYAVT